MTTKEASSARHRVNVHPCDASSRHDDVHLGAVDVMLESVECRHFVHQ